jgi:CheY-like chemotaxis protein
MGPGEVLLGGGALEVFEPLSDNVSFGGTRVLLVDDDTRNLFAIRTVLESRGIEVVHAENGRAALEVLKQDPGVNMVLMDTMMPEMDGLTATREIRERLKLEDLPIISLTAKAMKGDREKALEAGASDYVTKPVDPQRLLAVMHAWRARARRTGTNE